MSFLKAEWRKLALANYVVDPSILQPYLPEGTVLDTWNDRCYVSLVGFMFLNTRLLGIRIPYHVNFEEVNLRFYVNREVGDELRRGVVFIKEIVPKPALSFVANTIYKENYECLPMKHTWNSEGSVGKVSYSWKRKIWNSFEVKHDTIPIPIAVDSETEFITEHYWGYAKVNNKTTNEYEVTHPKWEHYAIKDYAIDVDFGETYGKEFNFMDDLSPESVMLAEGSEITVENKVTLRF